MSEVSCKILDATSMHLPGTEVYRTRGLERHSSPTQNTNMQIYDLFFLHYLQCVADKGKIDDSSFDS